MSGEDTVEIRCKLNGERTLSRASPSQCLAAYLQTGMQLSGTSIQCEDGSCASCSIRLDGKVVRACMMLAVQADKCSIVTIEALTKSGEISDLQSRLAEQSAQLCERCLPGNYFTAAELLAEGEPSTRDEIRAFMAGNRCLCGLEETMIDAIEATMKKRAGIA